MKALEDPKTGIEAGLAALKMYMDRYDGNPKDALMAYNCGPGNAKAVGFVLSKAPAETQNYVENIQYVLGTTDGFQKQLKTAPDQSGSAAPQDENPKKAPLPATSLLHYLTPEEAGRYRPAGGSSLTK